MKKFNILIVLFLLTLAGNAFGQAAISMQGTIRNSSGAAVSDGTYSLTFKLYTSESGGSPVWTETQDNIKVVGGVYSAILGEVNPLNAAFNVPYYVGMSVDGGAELNPRFRLTSAPYALSLIGQGNTFPSSGTVGIGTASPDPNTALTVSGGSGDGKILVTAPGDKDAIFWMRSGNNLSGITMGKSGNFDINAPGPMNLSASRVNLINGSTVRAYTDNDGFIVNGRLRSTGTLWTENGDISSANGQNLRLYRDGDLHMLCRGDGWTEFKKGLTITGQTQAYFGNNFTYSVTWANTLQSAGPGNQGMSILASANVSASSFFTTSDRRIKKDLHLCSGKDALATLMQLEVTNYRHVDTLARGSGSVTGFIAQQVADVFPQAVTVETNSIPDIYGKPVSMELNENEAVFHMAAAHNLVVGDKVNIIQDGGERKVYEVLSAEGTSFSVRDWNTSFSQPEKVFVYGKEVNDFRQVDYDKIHNLNVSATQELARQLEQLRAENAELKRANETKTAELNRVLGDMQRNSELMNGRLAKLEALLEAGNSKR